MGYLLMPTCICNDLWMYEKMSDPCLELNLRPLEASVITTEYTGFVTD